MQYKKRFVKGVLKKYGLEIMSAKIINFPTDKKVPVTKPFYNSWSSIERGRDRVLQLPEKRSGGFEKALLIEELSKEMYTPEYFMLVE